MTLRTTLLWPVVLCAIAALTTSCSVPRTGPLVERTQEGPMIDQDLAEAKAQVLAWTSSLVATVPEDVIRTTWQNDEGSLLSCSESTYSWSSAAEIELLEEQELVPYLEVMAASWSTADGYSRAFEKTGLGHPRLLLTGPGGASISVDARGDRRRLVFTSFSACVADLADYRGGSSY